MRCGSAVRGLLSKVPGVSDVKVDIKAKTVTVKVAPGTSAEALAATVNTSDDFTAKVKP